LFHADGAPGIPPSEHSPLKRLPHVSVPAAPTYRSSDRYSRHRSAEPARPAAVPGLWPSRESLARRHVVSVPPAGCSLGFLPSRVFRSRALFRIPPELLSCAWRRDRPKPGPAYAPEFHSAPTWRHPTARDRHERRTPRPFWGSCTGTFPITRANKPMRLIIIKPRMGAKELWKINSWAEIWK
jgi:hypothetical protein